MVLAETRVSMKRMEKMMVEMHNSRKSLQAQTLA